MPKLDPFLNGAFATSSTPLGVSDTSWTLDSGQGANLPDTADGAFNLVIFDQTASPYNPIATSYEIIRVNTRSGDTLSSISRAQEGTTAIALSTGPVFGAFAGITAKTLSDLEASIQTGSLSFANGTSSGANIIEVDLNPVPAAYVDGMKVSFKSPISNTSGTPTLNVNGLGAKTIKSVAGQVLYNSSIQSGLFYTAIYRSTDNAFYLTANTFDNVVMATGLFVSGTCTGGPINYTYTSTFTPNVATSVVPAGSVIRFVCPANNTSGACDVAVDGGSAQAILGSGGSSLLPNDMVAGDVIQLVATGSGFQMIPNKVNITNRTSATAASGDEILIVDVSDSNNLKKTTVSDVVSTVSGISNSMGELYISSSSATTVATTSKWYKVAGTTTLRMSTSFDAGGTNNCLRYTGTPNVMAHAGATLSVTTATSNQVLGFTVAKTRTLATTNPLTTVGAGLATVDIYWPSHGAGTSDWVELYDVVGSIDGIPASELNAQHTITSIPSNDRIRITVTTTATTGGVSGGGSAVGAVLIPYSGIARFKNGSSADASSTAVHSMATLETNDCLELWGRNNSGASNFTVDFMNLFAMGIKF